MPPWRFAASAGFLSSLFLWPFCPLHHTLLHNCPPPTSLQLPWTGGENHSPPFPRLSSSSAALTLLLPLSQGWGGARAVNVDSDYCGNSGSVCVLRYGPSQQRLSVRHLLQKLLRLCCHCSDSTLRQMAAKISKQSLLNSYEIRLCSHAKNGFCPR